ncbi:MAG: tetratricopeptide repeat protein [Eubacteriales bacterium]|nr:tetratricopeptide repeat protein [Eubacteriales bacterium]
MSLKSGEIVKLQRSSAYWMGRADRHRRQGNHRRAAALLRHAVTLSPADSDLRVAYARALQEMECYEASNRAAFGALTLNSRHYACYGLIGRNMLALGREQEALDAFSRYLLGVKQAGGIAEYDEDLDELEAAENKRMRLQARYETQLNIASNRLSGGNLARAARALTRARPARWADERYDSLRSLLLQELGDLKGAVRSAQRACRRNPRSLRARCTLAGAWCQWGNRAKGASALLSAALCCKTTQDEQLFCYSAVSLGFPELALSVLRHALKLSPDRLPTVFNTGVVMLKLGRISDAESLLHHCRALDPTDVPARCTSRTIEQWNGLELKPWQVSYAAKALPFYPLLSPAESNDCLAQLAKAISKGTDVFCQELQEDESLYNLFLYELGDGSHQLGRLIPLLAEQLPPAFAERLFREALVQPTPDDRIKRFAAAALMNLGAKPPFVVWHGGRIAEINPSVLSRRDSNLSRIMLVRRMVDLERTTGDTRLMTHALRMLNMVTPRQRGKFVRDTNAVMRAALEQHYLLTYGLPDSARLQELLRYTADERRRVRTAFRDLCELMPLPDRKPAQLKPTKGGHPHGTD